jgi:putative ABC transport system substrate-binding protein
MKKSKKILVVLLAVAMLFTFASCTEKNDVLKIGVIQYAPHPSLDNCYTGFLEGLAEEGYVVGDNIEIDFQNAMGEMSNSDLQAATMVSSKYDMIMAIATPAAMSAYSAAKDTDIPVVFSAVSDAISCGLVVSNETPENNITGTSDVLPLEAQMQMIRSFLPDATKIGIIYTTSEPNSVTHLGIFKSLAVEYGFEIVEVGVTNASEVAAAVTTVISKGVDCINNFTDNNVVNNLSTVINAADEANIPVFGSEIEQVKNGCLAAEGIDYVELGRETGRIAARILNGEAAGSISVALISASEPVYNKTVANRLGIALPAAYSEAADVTNAE